VTVFTDAYQFNDLINGDPLLLRTMIPTHNSNDVKKGDTIEVICDRSRQNATIISDPLVIISRPEEGYNEISIEVIKSDRAGND